LVAALAGYAMSGCCDCPVMHAALLLKGCGKVAHGCTDKCMVLTKLGFGYLTVIVTPVTR